MRCYYYECKIYFPELCNERRRGCADRGVGMTNSVEWSFYKGYQNPFFGMRERSTCRAYFRPLRPSSIKVHESPLICELNHRAKNVIALFHQADSAVHSLCDKRISKLTKPLIRWRKFRNYLEIGRLNRRQRGGEGWGTTNSRMYTVYRQMHTLVHGSSSSHERARQNATWHGGIKSRRIKARRIKASTQSAMHLCISMQSTGNNNI